jgi:phosphoesterase RecJ-like protein
VKKVLKRIENIIRNNRRFFITSHIRQDGDNIGAQLALYRALVELGKEVVIQNADPVPDTFNFLPAVELIRISTTVDENWDVLFVLDAGDIERTGGITTEKFACVVKIDHHKSQKPFADVSFVRQEASATCEMLYDLFKATKLAIDPEIAGCLYTGILCDTGSFRFNNTNARVFEIAGDLVQAGADPAYIAGRIYEQNSFGRLRMLGESLSGLELFEDGKIAVMAVDCEMIERNGCRPWETENFIHHAQSIKTALAALFFQEISPGYYKLSLRSRGEVDVASVAEELGGGGHKCASGCRVRGNLDTIKQDIVARIRRQLTRIIREL